MLEQKVEMVGGRAVWSDEKDISILTKHLPEFGGSYASGRATEIVHGDNTRTWSHRRQRRDTHGLLAFVKSHQVHQEVLAHRSPLDQREVMKDDEDTDTQLLEVRMLVKAMAKLLMHHARDEAGKTTSCLCSSACGHQEGWLATAKVDLALLRGKCLSALLLIERRPVVQHDSL